jgi:hypothetical protein
LGILESVHKKGRVTLAQTGQRRSERVLLDLPVVISGQFPDQRPFQEETFTVTVSAHGALVMLSTKVALRQKLVVINPTNSDEREGRVAYVGSSHAGLSQVAVEFTQPAPGFWPISSPPPDWKNS